MPSPTDVEIKSHRPIIGRLIVAYKKFIRALINPYLKSVFEAEHRDVDDRIKITDDRFKDVNLRISMGEDMSRDLVRRMDSIALLLNQRLDDISKKQDEIERKLQLEANLEKNRRKTFAEK